MLLIWKALLSTTVKESCNVKEMICASWFRVNVNSSSIAWKGMPVYFEAFSGDCKQQVFQSQFAYLNFPNNSAEVFKGILGTCHGIYGRPKQAGKQFHFSQAFQK